VEMPILGDVAHVLEDLLNVWKSKGRQTNKEALTKWWSQIEDWRAVRCLSFKQEGKVIKPQYALERLEALTQKYDRYITTEVGQHQMWAAQYLGFEDPNRWMTSGGLGTMGYGTPASIGVQAAHRDALVINVAGEASWMMNMQEMGTAVQFNLPVKQFILNNERLGMVRQWQELLHGERYSQSWSEALPDFVKLAEAFGAKGILCEDAAELGRRHYGNDHLRRSGHFRLPRRKARKLLPHDPIGQGTQRDAFGRRQHQRCDRCKRQRAGLTPALPFALIGLMHPLKTGASGPHKTYMN
jgi:acetolactate synthase-1/2/3 large subunit